MDFHYTDRIGGAEVQAWLLAKELARRGYKVVYLAQSLSNKADVVEQIDGVEIHWLKPCRFFQWEASLRYYRLLKRINPDYVIQRMTSFTTGTIGCYATRHRKPFLWICTDDRIPDRWFFLRNEWKALQSKRSIARLYSPLWLLNAIISDVWRRIGSHNISIAFSQNQTQAAMLHRNFNLPSAVLPSGHESPASLMVAETKYKKMMILWVASLGGRKRPSCFIELARYFIGHDISFVMIGSHGDTEHVKQLFADAPPNLVWLGRLSFHEAERHFREATVFVNTSEAGGEGFPNTFIQSWLYGTPVASLGVDPDGLIRRQRLGIVSETVDELAQKLDRLLANPIQYEEMSNRVAAFAQQHYTIERVADRFLSAIGFPAPDSINSKRQVTLSLAEQDQL